VVVTVVAGGGGTDNVVVRSVVVVCVVGAEPQAASNATPASSVAARLSRTLSVLLVMIVSPDLIAARNDSTSECPRRIC
jgi:hypothetical protein